jgi:hypothetical protein
MSQLSSFTNLSSSVAISKRPSPVSQTKLGVNAGAGEFGFGAHYVKEKYSLEHFVDGDGNTA